MAHTPDEVLEGESEDNYEVPMDMGAHTTPIFLLLSLISPKLTTQSLPVVHMVMHRNT